MFLILKRRGTLFLKSTFVVALLSISVVQAQTQTHLSITGISSATGVLGTIVTITGTGFSSIAAYDIVKFDGLRATVSSADTVSLTVTVPIGASYNQITVQVGDKIATSKFAHNESIPCGASSFAAAIDYPTSGGVQGVVTGDFNEDGKLDLATCGRDDNVIILLGTGTGTFGAYTSNAIGTTLRHLAVGDFNGDGKQDLVTSNGNGTVSVLIGSGTGNFAPHVDYPVSSDAYMVSVGDFNNDGYQDLAAVNHESNSVSILLGTGLGTFAAKVDYPTGTLPYHVAVGDFNNDGYQDLAVSNRSANTLSVLLGTGTGTFGTKVDYPTVTLPNGIAVGDFNKDGKQDLAVACSFDKLSIYLGTGTGTFGEKTDYATANNASCDSIGDFNGDGNEDIVVGNGGAGRGPGRKVSVFIGDGKGTFAPKVDYLVGLGPYSTAVGDFNGDSKHDIVSGNSSGISVSVLLSSCTSTGEEELTVGESVFENSKPYAFAEGLTIHVKGLNGHSAQVTDNQGRVLGNFTESFRVASSGMYIVHCEGYSAKVLVR